MELAEVDYYQNNFYDDYLGEEEELMNDVIVKSGLLEFDSDSEDEEGQEEYDNSPSENIITIPSPVALFTPSDPLEVIIKEEDALSTRFENIPGTSKEIILPDCHPDDLFIKNSQGTIEYLAGSETVSNDGVDIDFSPVNNSNEISTVIKIEVPNNESENVQLSNGSETEFDPTQSIIKEIIDINPEVEIKEEPIEHNFYNLSTNSNMSPLSHSGSQRDENVILNKKLKDKDNLNIYNLILKKRLELRSSNNDGRQTLDKRKGSLDMEKFEKHFNSPRFKKDRTLSEFHFKIESVDLQGININFVCLNCGEILPDYTDILSHSCLANSKTVPTLECFYCRQFVISNVDCIKDHFSGVADYFRLNKRISSFRCCYKGCKFISPSSTCFSLHIKLSHCTDIISYKATQFSECHPALGHKCPICQDIFCTESTLNNHLYLRHDLKKRKDFKFTCPFCDFKAVYMSSLKVHMNFAHKKNINVLDKQNMNKYLLTKNKIHKQIH